MRLHRALSRSLPGPGRLQTRLTERLGARVPVVLSPMSDCAGGELAAAVSAAGGIGLVGSGGQSLAHLCEQWALAASYPHVEMERLGVGLNVPMLHTSPPGTLEDLLSKLRPRHVLLSFGDDIRPHAAAILSHGATLYASAGDCEGALAHAGAGATCIVVQGSDARGHTYKEASAFSLVPQVRDALDRAGHAETLVLASGGVSDGRGLAAALVLGADAALVGTRLAATNESLLSEKQKGALVSVRCGARGTTLGRFIDELNGADRSELPGRCIANQSTQMEIPWRLAWGGSGHGGGNQRMKLRIRHTEGIKQAGGDGLEWGTTWAGASVGLVRQVQPAADVLSEMAAQAAAAFAT